MMNTTEYNRNFWNAMRRGSKGDIALIPREGRHVMTDTYQWPAESGRKYIAKLEKASLFRQLATVVRAEKNDSHIWTFDSDDMADWVGDRSVDVRDGIEDFTRYETNAHKLAAMTRLGDDFTSDLKFDIEDYLTTVFAKKFAKAEDNAFINGDGVDKPIGILHSENGAEVGATVATLTFDDITKLYFSVKPEYRMGGYWMMNDETALYLRNLKDAAGNYLWRGNADTLLGKPVVISNEMPSIGKNAKPVAFGDFSYYWIINRFPMTVKVLKEIFAMYGQNGYLAYEFLDGRLIRPEAIKVIQMAE